MEDKKGNHAVLVLLLVPVFMALDRVIVNHGTVDLIYLIIVGIMFLKYFYQTKKAN